MKIYCGTSIDLESLVKKLESSDDNKKILARTITLTPINNYDKIPLIEQKFPNLQKILNGYTMKLTN